jgi:hypothetical protein
MSNLIRYPVSRLEFWDQAFRSHVYFGVIERPNADTFGVHHYPKYQNTGLEPKNADLSARHWRGEWRIQSNIE